ncbi:Rho GTPase activation protein [Chlamydoabsidia padenii]|nr:Rho GTPase activation protein [Chlamydoabsidia padenii]
MQAAKDACFFLKKRAAIEEEYGKQMIKLSQTISETFDKSHPRSGTYGDAWVSMLKVHETIGDQRIKFASNITEVAEDLQLLYKDTERGRKQAKDAGGKYEKMLGDANTTLEKTKQKYELQNEDWERTILQKNNDPLHVPKKGLFKNAKSQAQELKAIGDECCVALRYQLARYSYIYEEALAADGIALDNDDGLGLRSLTEKIDKDSDLIQYINSYNGRSEVPWILRKCAEVVEMYGLNVVGIYRLSGTNSQIQKLKAAFDRDCNGINLKSEEYISDINNITSVLKLWFRELPDPLFPRAAYQQFLNAAKTDDDNMRILGLHTVINDLPDAHYATLKYLMCHLDKIQKHQRYNKMGASNLATIFGMTLMGNESAGNIQPMVNQDNQRFTETQWQVKVVQSILENYSLIFETD